MRPSVLFIGSRHGGDWGMDLVWAGLVRLLGPERVIDWPQREKHRAGRPTWDPDDVEGSYGAERRSLCYTGVDVPWHELSTVRAMVANGLIGLVVVDERTVCFEHFVETWCHLARAVPVVVVAGHDRFWNNPEAVVEFYGPQLRGIYTDVLEATGVASVDRLLRPYRWSMNLDHLWDPAQRRALLTAKTTDVFFAGFASNPDRRRFIDHIARRWRHLNLSLFLEEENGRLDRFLPKRQFFEEMARARVCVNLNGAAVNGKTMRYWEIPYVGSFMASQVAHPSAQPLASVCYFTDEDELDALIDRAMRDGLWREQLADVVRDATSNHSCEAEVRRLLEDALPPSSTMRSSPPFTEV